MDDVRIQLASDGEHDRVFAEIYVDSRFVALVSQDQGLGHLRLELPGPNLDEALVRRDLPLSTFLSAVERAVERLTQPGGNERGSS